MAVRFACGSGDGVCAWRPRPGPSTACLGHVEAADGSLWSLRTSWVLPDDGAIADRLEVYGSDGATVLSLEPPVEYLGSKTPLGHELTGDPLTDAMVNEVAHFCACARAVTPSSIVTLADAIHGLHIAEAIVASTESDGASIEVVTDTTR